MVETIAQAGRRSGWSDRESNLLWEAADEAQQQGLPLKAVFERIASETGRRPNSIRNYYYAQVQKRSGAEERPARFVPFTEEEVTKLMDQVLRARAKGHSVRSCLQKMAGGDHSLMLRFQNKYRSVIKARPELVSETVERLRGEGLDVYPPEVNHRPRMTLENACRGLGEAARQKEDPELIRACEALTKLMLASREAHAPGRSNLNVRLDLYRMALDDKQHTIRQLGGAAQELIDALKEFLGQPGEARENQVSAFCASISERIGLLEQRLQELEV
ncbi:hypothetical protein ACH6CV_05090 [Bacillota bacterium Meth-B3]|nr:hypothetical protein [Christensenellaceae bacterium]MEA5064735.1 hypothetical protein [Eubacteriales bacterium]MEA5068812.1 hypothetical protein [Christensenellaceae bacterium]